MVKHAANYLNILVECGIGGPICDQEAHALVLDFSGLRTSCLHGDEYLQRWATKLIHCNRHHANSQAPRLVNSVLDT